MTKKVRIITALITVLVVGACAGLYVLRMVKAHPETTAEYKGEAPAIKTSDLAKEYATDEKGADTKYLNKMLTLAGTIAETEKNQDGGLTVMLETGDPSMPIQCAMESKDVNLAKGQNVTIQGRCTGNTITGVSFTGCIIK